MMYEGIVAVSLLHKHGFPNEELFACKYKSGKIYEDLSTEPLILLRNEYPHECSGEWSISSSVILAHFG